MPVETLAAVVLLPLLLGPIAAIVGARTSRRASAAMFALVVGAALALVLAQAGNVFDGGAPRVAWPWVSGLGLDIALRLDGLSLLFCLLILCVGLLVILYAHYYLGPDDPPGKFFALLALFMAAMLGIVLADNLLLLAVFWELTSLTSFLLIGFWSRRADARQGARMALAVTGGGGLAMLAGFLVLGDIAGTYEISTLLGMREQIHADARYPLALVLILLGAFTKSAQFPFHFWLPEAMAAPTPVSAYLHSATMVKAGIFLLARLYPVLGGSLLFEYIVAITGLVTMVFAAYVAVFKHDLKGLLAYSTISHLGLITFLIGLDSPLSAVAAVFHIINHATFKASLFMAAGIIDHECGSRDMRKLNGLWHFMPHTATLAMVAAASMAGVPLFNGFLSKEMFFAEALQLGHLGWLGAIAPLAVTLGGLFSVAYSTRFIHDVFFNGEPVGLTKTPHEPPRFMKVPVEVLVLLCIAVGIVPNLTGAPLVNRAALDVYGAPLPPYTLALWHGFSLPLAMSAIAIAGGVLMYWLLQRRYNLHLHAPSGWTLRLVYQKTMTALVDGSAWLTARMENGSLQRYLALMLGAAIVLAAVPLAQGLVPGPRKLLPVGVAELIIWAIVVVAAIGCVVVHRARLVALVFAGVVGLVTALAFMRFSAPDLALTQLSVEVVGAVLMLMALALLPQRTRRESSTPRRMRDGAIAIAGGGGMALLAYAAMTRDPDTISWFFLEQSVPKGGGSNAVNVLLVDFRGYDTFGEITVLGIAAIGVLALMQGLRIDRPLAAPDGRPWSTQLHPLLLTVVSRMLLPLALLVAVYIFLRGHNQPGGGFVAGLITSVALVTQYIAQGYRHMATRLRLDYARLIGIGLLIAGITGMAAWLFGAPFLTSAHGHPHVPLLGEIPLASAAAFDLGVYLTVVGATMLTLVTLGGVSRSRQEA